MDFPIVPGEKSNQTNKNTKPWRFLVNDRPESYVKHKLLSCCSPYMMLPNKLKPAEAKLINVPCSHRSSWALLPKDLLCQAQTPCHQPSASVPSHFHSAAHFLLSQCELCRQRLFERCVFLPSFYSFQPKLLTSTFALKRTC